MRAQSALSLEAPFAPEAFPDFRFHDTNEGGTQLSFWSVSMNHKLLEFRNDYQKYFDAKVGSSYCTEASDMCMCNQKCAYCNTDIIRRAFRGTRVGIDIEGKMMKHIRFPGFETYEPPTKDEKHLDQLLTEDDIKELEKAEIQYQKKKKKRKKVERDENMRKRAKKRSSEIIKFFCEV